MKNSKIWTIIKHEYISKVRSKGFIISTVAGPLVMLLIILVPAAVTYFTLATESDGKEIILINDATGKISDKIIKTDSNKYKNTNASESELEKKILLNEIFAALIVDSNSINNGKAKILINESAGLKLIDKLREIVNSEIKKIQLNNAGIDKSTIELVNSTVNFEIVKVTKEGTVKDDSEVMAVISYFAGFVMYFLMFLYGSQVMQGVLEEKVNRIIEVLASSATSFQIMFGKVVGIGAVGLTQVVIWLLFGGGMLLIIGLFINSQEILNLNEAMNSNQMNQMANNQEMVELLTSFQLPSISIWHLIGFIFYFLSGYFILATLFAAAGSTVDQMQDANSMSGILSVIVIIPIMLISNITLNPEGTFAIITSLFPFFAPILMVARIISINIPLWQIILSVVLQVATFLLCLKVAAKIYRIGMLKYGKKANLKEIFLWLKQP